MALASGVPRETPGPGGLAFLQVAALARPVFQEVLSSKPHLNSHCTSSKLPLEAASSIILSIGKPPSPHSHLTRLRCPSPAAAEARQSAPSVLGHPSASAHFTSATRPGMGDQVGLQG